MCHHRLLSALSATLFGRQRTATRNARTVERALRDGATLRAFRSGAGLRVLTLRRDGQDIAYGEGPQVEDALVRLAEDIRAGGRPYDMVYGVTVPHYVTGAGEPSSPFDHWIARGFAAELSSADGAIHVRLEGSGRTTPPRGMMERVRATGAAERFSERGFTFETHRSPKWEGVVTRVIETPPDAPIGSAWSYPVVVTGSGRTLAAAIDAALEGVPPAAQPPARSAA